MDLEKELPKILQKNGISAEEISQISIEKPNLLGEHMSSDCLYCTVKFKEEFSKKPLELFVKSSPSNPSVKSMVDALNAFESESKFFNISVPQMEKFVHDRIGTNDLLNFLPKIWFADEQTIIMENFLRNGYKMLDKIEKVDYDQAKLAIEELAKFHAISHLMINDLGSREKFLEKYPFTRESIYLREKKSIFGDFMEPTISALINILKVSNVEGSTNAYEKLEKYDGKVFDYYCDLFGASEPLYTQPTSLFYTLSHGDFWTNNMMFGYKSNSDSDEKSGIFTELKVFDFQVLGNASPNIDLNYFLYTSVKSDIRRVHRKELLQIYYDRFQSVVHLLKGKLSFTFDEFFKDSIHNSFIGLFYGIFMTASEGVLASFDHEQEQGDNLIEGFSNKILTWLEKNQDKGEKLVHEILQLIQEYEEYIKL